VPAAQLLQLVEPVAAWKLPDEQTVQVVEPEPELYLPDAHDTHDDAAAVAA